MKVAVISDIHSNLPALESVLEAIEAQAPDELWCLGDVVGYGADPDACARLVAEQTNFCLAGNHDLVVTGEIEIGAFASTAAAAARWTIQTITEETLRFLSGLRPAGERDDVGLYHASPRDPVWEYVLSLEQAEIAFELQDRRICLIGHSHVACFFQSDPDGVSGDQAHAGLSLDAAKGKWLLNPGSVGQPRDGDPRAAYLLLDTSSGQAEFRRVEYPIDSAAKAIIEAGLPRQLADRLYVGQ